MNWRLFSPATWRAGMLDALRRFPLAVLCGATATACGIVAIHWSKDSAIVDHCERLAMSVALGLPLFFALRMVRESATRWRRWPLELLGLLVMAWWFLAHRERLTDAPGIVFIKWLLLLAALHCFAAISPFLRRGEGPAFWQFNRRLFVRFSLTTLYSAVLTAGLELALLSADKLFELRLEKAYADLWFIMAGCFHPIFFFAGVPRDLEELEGSGEHPRGLKAFTQFALAPLVLVYGLILYAYAFKIVALRAWPHGWVALPVLILSGVGIFAALLLHPLRNDAAEKWAVWFARVFPPALAPLAILLLLSLRVRIADYGVTEERYVGVVASLWILAWSIVFTVRRTAGIRWMPASLALIALATAYGPWSAGAVSKRSQLTRVAQMLQARGLWNGDHAKPADEALELPKAEGTSLRSTIDYLINMHGLPCVAGVIPNAPKGAVAILNALNITIETEHASEQYRRKSQRAVDVTGFHRLCNITMYSYNQQASREQRCDDLRFNVNEGSIVFALGDGEALEPVPLDQLLGALPPKSASELDDDALRLDFERGGRFFRIIFTELQVERQKDRPAIKGFSMMLMER